MQLSESEYGSSGPLQSGVLLLANVRVPLHTLQIKVVCWILFFSRLTHYILQ